MKKTLLISIGAFIILLIIGVWVYLMMFGAPENTNDALDDIGILPDSSRDVAVRIDDSGQTPTINVLGPGLQQLTTKAIAGATFIDNNIRFVEQGTGHIYDIDLESGRESQVTRSTIPLVTSATFSPDGQRVALTSYQGYQTSVVVGDIEPDGTLDTTPLEPDARNVAFINDTTVAYTITSGGGTTGYEQSLSSQVRTEVFQFSFSNLLVAWGTEEQRPIVYTKPTSELVSFAYYVNDDGTLEVATSPSVNQSLIYTDTELINTRAVGDSTLASVAMSNSNITYPFALIREKCTANDIDGVIWCGVPFTDIQSDELIEWYKGATQLSDSLWEIRVEFGAASPVVIPEDTIGRPLDIISPVVTDDGSAVSFINKTDSSLWLYRLDS